MKIELQTIHTITLGETDGWHCKGSLRHVLDMTLLHLEKNHIEEYKKLVQKGRDLAMSQNGMGYSDSGRGNKGGWFEAPESFRWSWTRQALEYALKEGKI